MEGEKGGKVIILLLIPILTLLVSREGAEISGAEKGNLIPVSRSRKVVCLHHPQGASCCSGRRGGGGSLSPSSSSLTYGYLPTYGLMAG